MAQRHWLDSNGNWTTAADWTGDKVPRPADDAFIDAPGPYTVTEDSSSAGPINVHSIEIAAGTALAITGVAGNRVGGGGIANAGTMGLHDGTTLAVTGTFSNSGTLGVDNAAPGFNFAGDPGGSTLTIGQTLSNSGTLAIGNTGLAATTEVSASGLRNTGTITLDGSAGKRDFSSKRKRFQFRDDRHRRLCRARRYRRSYL